MAARDNGFCHDQKALHILSGMLYRTYQYPGALAPHSRNPRSEGLLERDAR